MRILALFALVSMAQSFVLVTPPQLAKHSLSMSAEPLQEDDYLVEQEQCLGATERLLLEKKKVEDLGLVQKYGETIKKDGFDGLRAFVWKIFDVSNYVFPALGVAMSFGLLLNMAGYGYYLDDGGVVIDTLQNIQEDQFFQEQVIKLAADAADKAASGMF